MKICKICEKDIPNRHNKIYCSNKCKFRGQVKPKPEPPEDLEEKYRLEYEQYSKDTIDALELLEEILTSDLRHY